MSKFGPGKSGNPAGRPPGSKNKTTEEIRDVFRELIEGNLENLREWISEVGNKDPYKAVMLVLKLAGYVLPRFTSISISGQDRILNSFLESLDDAATLMEQEKAAGSN